MLEQSAFPVVIYPIKPMCSSCRKQKLASIVCFSCQALTNFRGGIIMIEPKTDFVERICNEKWLIEAPLSASTFFRVDADSQIDALLCGTMLDR